VFVYAAVPKLLDWHKFAEAVSRYDMLPGLLVDFTALVMPALELVVGMMLVMGVYKRSTAWLTILMNLVFMVAMSQALIRGLDTSCGCFANGEDLLTWWDVVRDLVLIAMAGFIIRGERAVVPRPAGCAGNPDPLAGCGPVCPFRFQQPTLAVRVAGIH